MSVALEWWSQVGRQDFFADSGSASSGASGEAGGSGKGLFQKLSELWN